MFDSWLPSTGGSRWRRVACVCAAAASLAVVLVFWSDFCLWRADGSLAARNPDAAAAWGNRSRWLGRAVDSRICLLQLRIARARQDFHEVERLLQRAGRVGVPRSEIERERRLAQAQTGQFDAMQRYWEQLLADPRDDGPQIARAYYSWLMLHHDLLQAEQTLKLWHADYPDDPEPLALAGKHYEALFKWEGVEESYRQALALDPRNDAYRLSLAKALQVRLKTDAAIPLFREYLERHPDDLVALQGLAQCLATKGDLSDALELLKKAVTVDPDDFATQKAYGELLLSAGEPKAAVPFLEKAYRAVPEHANLANALALALKASGRGDEAKPLFAFVAESRPQLDELNTLESQLRKDPANPELRMKIAAITARYVSRRDAIRWLQTLLHTAPDYAPAHEALADLYSQTGDEARAAYHANRLEHCPPAASSTVMDLKKRSGRRGGSGSNTR